MRSLTSERRNIERRLKIRRQQKERREEVERQIAGRRWENFSCRRICRRRQSDRRVQGIGYGSQYDYPQVI